MNTIAAQIDQAADILRATNDLLEARAKHRDAQAHGNVEHAGQGVRVGRVRLRIHGAGVGPGVCGRAEVLGPPAMPQHRAGLAPQQAAL